MRLLIAATLLSFASPTHAQAQVHGVAVNQASFITSDTGDFVGNLVDVAPQADSIFALDFDETGTTLWGIDNNSSFSGTLDLTSGIFTPVAPTGQSNGATGLTCAVDGTWYMSDFDGVQSNLYVGDPAIGFTAVGAMITGIVIDIAIDSQGNLYAHSITDDSLYFVDANTGVATLIGPTGQAANFAQGMDFDWSTDTLYATIYTGGGTGVFAEMSLATGFASVLQDTTPTGKEMEIALRPEPICMSTPNTDFEPNNDCAQAQFLVGGVYPDLFVDASDPDFFSIRVGPGKTLRVIVDFPHTDGDIDLRVWELLGSCPGTLLGDESSSGQRQNWEEFQVSNVSSVPIDYIVEVHMPGTSSGICNNYSMALGCCAGGPVGSRYCTSVPNSTGFAARIFASGSALVSANDLCLTAGPLPPGTFGVFIAAPNQTQVPFGDGFLCVAGSIQRLTVAGGGGSTVVCHDLDVPGSGFLPGDTRNFQFWYRDPPGGPAGFNLTDALSILFQ